MGRIPIVIASLAAVAVAVPGAWAVAPHGPPLPATGLIDALAAASMYAPANERANLQTAKGVLAAFTDAESAWSAALDVAAIAGEQQAHRPLLAATPLSHAQPSRAALALASARGAAVDPAALAALDALPDAGALARLFDAVLAFDTATRAAFASADTDRLEGVAAEVRRALADSPEDPEAAAAPARDLDWAAAGLDLAPVLAARQAVLAAVADLDGLAPVPATAPCAPLQMPPTFSIDLALCNNTYVTDFELLVDAGGDDLYLNNAGGNNLHAGACVLDLNNPTVGVALDLAGNDRYGDPLAPKSCGVNGGAVGGAALLVDASGTDRYAADSLGVNGGAFLGAALLVDALGDDDYAAINAGANGGGFLGAGAIVDAEGADHYTAFSLGTNGGGETGAGFLADGAGNDRLVAFSSSTNGGSAGLRGAGFLMNAAGDDVYDAQSSATNGGGNAGGTGFLLDASGNDAYTAGGIAANGGGFLGGMGALVDGAGNDAYTASVDGTNGGAFGRGGIACDIICILPRSHGLLVDGAGADRYTDSTVACNDCTRAPKGVVGAQLDLPHA